MAIPHIYFKDYKNEALNVPSLEIQKEKSKTLDNLVKLIDIKEQILKKYDDLVKSQFIEMFENKNFPIKSLSEISLIKSGSSIPLDKENEGGNVMYIKVSDMNLTGNEKYSELVKLALNILRIENNIAISNSGSRKEFPNSSIFDFCEKNYNELSQIASDIKDYKKRTKKDWGVGHYPKAEDSVIGALMWELAHIDGNDYELVKDYTFGLFTLNSHKNAVVDKFRKQICKDSKLSNKNGAMHFTAFRNKYKDNFYKYLKTAVKTAM